MIPAPLLTAENLAIMRGERALFRDISLLAAAGEAVVLRGANGAGKTTMLRILAGLTQPELGSVTRNAPHHWLGHTNGIKPDETPHQHLKRWAQAWGSDWPVQSILEHVKLEQVHDVPARLLSAGQKRRLAIGRMKLETRLLWFLDEPFAALDAPGREMLLTEIAMLRAGGGVVIAAIHGDAGFEATQEVAL